VDALVADPDRRIRRQDTLAGSDETLVHELSIEGGGVSLASNDEGVLVHSHGVINAAIHAHTSG
jgi:hypothetical protein